MKELFIDSKRSFEDFASNDNFVQTLSLKDNLLSSYSYSELSALTKRLYSKSNVIVSNNRLKKEVITPIEYWQAFTNNGWFDNSDNMLVWEKPNNKRNISYNYMSKSLSHWNTFQVYDHVFGDHYNRVTNLLNIANQLGVRVNYVFEPMSASARMSYLLQGVFPQGNYTILDYDKTAIQMSKSYDWDKNTNFICEDFLKFSPNDYYDLTYIGKQSIFFFNYQQLITLFSSIREYTKILVLELLGVSSITSSQDKRQYFFSTTTEFTPKHLLKSDYKIEFGWEKSNWAAFQGVLTLDIVKGTEKKSVFRYDPWIIHTPTVVIQLLLASGWPIDSLYIRIDKRRNLVKLTEIDKLSPLLLNDGEVFDLIAFNE